MIRNLILMAFALIVSSTAGAQSIEKTKNVEGGKILITSSEKIFSRCWIRMCKYTGKDGERIYGIEVDMKDRTDHVCEGNNLTIHFEDGSRITVSNLWDAKADVKHESYVRTYDHSVTDFVPVYDAWADAIYAEPVTHHYTEHVPETSSTSFIQLFYILTPEQIQKIIKSDIQDVTIVTDEETIVKKARPFSQAVATLYEVIK